MIPTLIKCSAVAVTLFSACNLAVARHVNARLVYFSPSSDDPSELFTQGDTEDEFVRCQPKSSVTSDPISFQIGESGKIHFARTGKGGDVVASATVPPGVSEAVFFFLKQPAPSGKEAHYQILVVDESARALPKGGSYVCNIAPQNVRMTIGEFKYELPPGKPVYLKRPGTDDYHMAPFQVRMQSGDSWIQVKDSALRFAPTERYFIISYLEPSGSRPAVKIYKQAVR